jgi:hypothetical protein
MEAILQHFASLDILQVFIHAIPAIFKPFLHSFESLYILMFEDIKAVFGKDPGLIMGLLTVITFYAAYEYFQHLKRNRLRAIMH